MISLTFFFISIDLQKKPAEMSRRVDSQVELRPDEPNLHLHQSGADCRHHPLRATELHHQGVAKSVSISAVCQFMTDDCSNQTCAAPPSGTAQQRSGRLVLSAAFSRWWHSS